MYNKNITTNKDLFNRNATEFSRIADKFKCRINIKKGDRIINAKSIIGLLSLAITTGDEISVICDGNDELNAYNELQSFLKG